MGFQTGNILEPSMGIGNFFGMLPEEMRNSRLYGVELDSISGRIAKQLYPQANITVAGFETTDRRDFYDLAVGNVPFGQYQVDDRAYNKLGFTIHNYSFTVVDGEVYYRENSIMVKPDLNATARERVKGMVELRDCVRSLIDLQMDGVATSSISLASPQAAKLDHSAAAPFPTKPDDFAGALDTDSAISEKQAELNRLYDAFTAKYGLINDRGNRLAFADDDS